MTLTTTLEEPRAVRNRWDKLKVITDCTQPSRTKQSMRDDCDINLIVRKYAQTGMWDHLPRTEPHYGDATQAVDLQAAFAMVDTAVESFGQLPAQVRKLCRNDPAELLQRLSDPTLTAELALAGLPMAEGWKPPEPPAPPAPEPAPQPTPAT